MEDLNITMQFQATDEMIMMIESDCPDLMNTAQFLNGKIHMCFELTYLEAKLKGDSILITAGLRDTSMGINLSELNAIKDCLGCFNMVISS